MQHHFTIFLENNSKQTLRNNYFAVENIQVIAEGELVNRFLQLEPTICVLCYNKLFTKSGF
jgi:hypothetical protein